MKRFVSAVALMGLVFGALAPTADAGCGRGLFGRAKARHATASYSHSETMTYSQTNCATGQCGLTQAFAPAPVQFAPAPVQFAPVPIQATPPVPPKATPQAAIDYRLWPSPTDSPQVARIILPANVRVVWVY